MGIGVRRGVRLAIAIPAVLGILLLVLRDSAGIAFAMFFCTSILGTADFAGTARVRTLAVLATGAVCVPVVALGLACGRSAVLAVLVSLIVGALLFYVGVLRGLVAAGAPAVTAQFAVAVTSSATLADFSSVLIALCVAMAICIAALLLILPFDARAHVRDGIADTLSAMGHVARLAWSSGATKAELDAGLADIDEHIACVERQFGGQPFRPAGVSRRDRALMDLVARLRLTRDAQHALLSHPRSIIPGTRELGANSGSALEHSAALLRDPSAPAPDLTAFPRLLDEHHTSCREWVQEHSGEGEATVTQLRHAHATRVVSAMVEQVAALSCASVGIPVDEESLNLPPRTPWWQALTVNTNRRSPWILGAVRGGVAIAIGAAVVHLTDVSMGLWVLFGVISVLRVDALSTRRTAWQVVWGTAVGATLGTLIVLAANSLGVVWPLWLLLPIASMMLGWAPTVTKGVAISQIAFSSMVLIAFAIIQWPTDLMLGLTRIENMSIGAAVAIACAALLWPHGVMGFLRTRVADAVTSAATYLHDAVGAFVGDSTSARADAQLTRARHALTYSTEAVDLALVQRGRGDRLMPWLRVGDAAGATVHVARMLLHLLSNAHPDMNRDQRDAVVAARQHADEAASDLNRECLSQTPEAAVRPSDPPSMSITVPSAVDSADAAEALCATVWIVDYLDLIARLNAQAQFEISGAAKR